MASAAWVLPPFSCLSSVSGPSYSLTHVRTLSYNSDLNVDSTLRLRGATTCEIHARARATVRRGRTREWYALRQGPLTSGQTGLDLMGACTDDVTQ